MIYSPANLSLFKEEAPRFLEAVKQQQARLVLELQKDILARPGFPATVRPEPAQPESFALPSSALFSPPHESRASLRGMSYTDRSSTPLAKRG